LIISLALFFAQPKILLAAEKCSYDECRDGCTTVGQCVDGVKCIAELNQQTLKVTLLKGKQPCGGSAVIGGIDPPQGIAEFNAKSANSGGEIGALVFVSSIIRFFFLIAGLIVLANFIISAYDYITNAGDFKIHMQAKDRLTFSLEGVVIMVAAFILVSLIGAVIFGDPGFILKQNIEQYGALNR